MDPDRIDPHTIAEQAVDRRTGAGDRDLAAMPDPDNLLALARHLVHRRRLEPPTDKAAGVLRDDAVDVLLLVAWIRRQLDRVEHAAIGMYVDPLAGAGQYRGLAEPLGLRTRQAVSQRHKRLAAALAAEPGETRDPAGAARRSAADEAELAAAGEQWPAARRIVAGLLERRAELPAVQDVTDSLDLLDYYASLETPTGREQAALVGYLAVLRVDLGQVGERQPTAAVAALLAEAAEVSRAKTRPRS